MSQGSSFIQKIRLLGQKVCSVARGQTDRHESENRGHPFMVSGFFFQIFLQPIIKEQSKIIETTVVLFYYYIVYSAL